MSADQNPSSAADELEKPETNGETEAERLNRNFNELLQEVRVAQNGVQILFAFLLTLPFTQRFGELDGERVTAYGISIVGAALAAVTLVAPVSYHRLAFRMGRKPDIVRYTAILAQLGLVLLGIALVAACFLVADVVLGTRWGIGFGVLVAGIAVVLWYVIPLAHREQEREQEL